MSAEHVLSFGALTGPGINPGTRLRSLDLTAPGLPRRRFGGVSGRFGAVVAMAPEVLALPLAPVVDMPEARTQRPRIVRRLPAESDQPPVSSQPEPMRPMPAQHARFHHDFADQVMRGRRVAGTAAERKSGFWFAVVLMVMAWAGIVAVGALFFNTPRSGFKVEWR